MSDGKRKAGHDKPDYRVQNLSAWSYGTTEPILLAALRDVATRLPSDIYRCKGVVNSAAARARRTILQVVGKRVDLSLDSAWGEGTPRTQIVALGAAGA